MMNRDAVANDAEHAENLEVKPSKDPTLAVLEENKDNGLDQDKIDDEGSNGEGLGTLGHDRFVVHCDGKEVVNRKFDLVISE